MTDTEIEIPPARVNDPDGNTIFVLLYSPRLAPCDSVTFRMFYNAITSTFRKARILKEHKCGGAFGTNFAFCVAQITNRCAAILKAREALEDLGVSKLSYVAMFDEAELDWRLMHAGQALNLQVDFFMQEERLIQCREILKEESERVNRIFAEVITRAEKE